MSGRRTRVRVVDRVRVIVGKAGWAKWQPDRRSRPGGVPKERGGGGWIGANDKLENPCEKGRQEKNKSLAVVGRLAGQGGEGPATARTNRVVVNGRRRRIRRCDQWVESRSVGRRSWLMSDGWEIIWAVAGRGNVDGQARKLSWADIQGRALPVLCSFLLLLLLPLFSHTPSTKRANEGMG